MSEKEKNELQGDTMIKGKHIFFLRLQLLLAALNVTHSYARERVFSHLEMQLAHIAFTLAHTSAQLHASHLC